MMRLVVALYAVGMVFWVIYNYILLHDLRTEIVVADEESLAKRRRSLARRIVGSPLWPCWVVPWMAREVVRLAREAFGGEIS